VNDVRRPAIKDPPLRRHLERRAAALAAAVSAARSVPIPAAGGGTPEPSGWPDGRPVARLWSARAGPGCTSPILVGAVFSVARRNEEVAR